MIQQPITTTDTRFVIPMVPPNLTGELHLGHALMACVQDCLVRFHHLHGQEITYIPGVDHAGIGMYAQVRASDSFRPDLPLESRLTEWASHYREVISGQFRLLNLACNWEREIYTMEPTYIRLVHHAFRRLAEGGLLYRDYKVVHWCPNCQTTLSDMECDRVTRDTKVGVMGVSIGKRTQLVESSQPELLWSAAALVVPPPSASDALPSPFGGPPLPIIEWEQPGRRASFVVPAHNAEHLALARRYDLPVTEALDAQGRSLLPAARGMSRQELREWTIAQLGMKTVLKPVELSLCSRCHTELLARLSWQWFLRMRPLAQLLEEAILSGKVVILPESQKRQALAWLSRVDDWCISRQIPWGQQIPAHICSSCAGWSIDEREECSACGGRMQSEHDVFDTWFSCALWPLAAAGWPVEQEVQRLYPMSTLTTGRDILFFFLIRVLALNHYLTGEYPAPISYLHGLVLDANGVKMSKSRGNTVTLREGVEQYGVDVLRTMLLSACHGADDIPFRADLVAAPQKIAGVLGRLEALAEADRTPLGGVPTSPDALDRRLLAAIVEAEEQFSQALASYQFAHAGAVLRTFSMEALSRFVAIRERERTMDSRQKQGLWAPVLRRVANLFLPFMPGIAHQLESLAENCQDESEVAAIQASAIAADALLTAIRELERLRGALGINTYTTTCIVLPPEIADQLTEGWVKYASLLLFQIGHPMPNTVAWCVPGYKDIVLHLPERYAARLRKEALGQLRKEAKQRHSLARHVAAARTDTQRARQALPALQKELQAVLERITVLQQNIGACEQVGKRSEEERKGL